jgi:uncharacterized protein YacL
MVIRNLLAIILGLIVGSVLNMSLIILGGYVVPPPVGADMNTMEGLQAAMPLFQAQHFIFPFLAHALGSLAGAFVAVKISKQAQLMCALIIGFLFQLGGISMVVQLPAPFWFNALDLLCAYMPMAYLGFYLAYKPSV